MWPIVMALVRRNAVYLTLPFAAIVGFIGYNVENLISDKYTPYSRKFQTQCSINEASYLPLNRDYVLSTNIFFKRKSRWSQCTLSSFLLPVSSPSSLSFNELNFSISESIQDNRADRHADDDNLANAAKVDKLKLKENVLGRNLSPSLQGKQ